MNDKHQTTDSGKKKKGKENSPGYFILSYLNDRKPKTKIISWKKVNL